VEELLAMLRETENLEEQGDILQYLVDTQGLDYNTGMLDEGKPITVKDLLKLLYEKACQQKLWGLVRHTAGMLGKRVEDLAKAVTDLLVRQKQVSFVDLDKFNFNISRSHFSFHFISKFRYSYGSYFIFDRRCADHSQINFDSVY
jgi:Glycosyl hydrolases family 15